MYVLGVARLSFHLRRQPEEIQLTTGTSLRHRSLKTHRPTDPHIEAVLVQPVDVDTNAHPNTHTHKHTHTQTHTHTHTLILGRKDKKLNEFVSECRREYCKKERDTAPSKYTNQAHHTFQFQEDQRLAH